MAVTKVTQNLDFLKQQQILNALIQVLSSAPTSPAEGQIYYNSTDKTLYIYTGSTWLDLGKDGTIGGSITDNQIAVGATTANEIEGSASFTWDGSNLIAYEAVNDGNPSFNLGSATAEKIQIQAIYDSAAQTLDRVDFTSYAASTTADKGLFRFNVDETAVAEIRDDGINLISGNVLKVNDTEILSATALAAAVQVPVNSLNSGTSASSSTFWRGDGTWATPAGGFSDFDAGGDSGTNQTVNSGDLLDVIGDTGITTTISKVATTVTIAVDLDDTAVSPGAQGSATNVSTFTVDQQGRLTAAGNVAISIPLTQVNDVTATASEVNLLDLSGLTAGWVLSADTATTASWQQLAGSDINNDLSWATETYVDNAVTGALNYQGGYNASTNTPDLDTSPSGILEGYTYTVTAAGTFFTEDVQIGDMLIAENDNPTTLAEWTVVNKNIPDIVSASDTAEGIIELATQAEVDARTDTTRAITPATLAGHLGTSATLSATVKYTQLIGNGAATDIVVTHNIGEQWVNAQVYEPGDGNSLILCEIECTSSTTTTFKFNTAPTTDQYRVVIIG